MQHQNTLSMPFGTIHKTRTVCQVSETESERGHDADSEGGCCSFRSCTDGHAVENAVSGFSHDVLFCLNNVSAFNYGT